MVSSSPPGALAQLGPGATASAPPRAAPGFLRSTCRISTDRTNRGPVAQPNQGPAAPGQDLQSQMNLSPASDVRGSLALPAQACCLCRRLTCLMQPSAAAQQSLAWHPGRHPPTLRRRSPSGGAARTKAQGADGCLADVEHWCTSPLVAELCPSSRPVAAHARHNTHRGENVTAGNR